MQFLEHKSNLLHCLLVHLIQVTSLNIEVVVNEALTTSLIRFYILLVIKKLKDYLVILILFLIFLIKIK